MARLAASSGRSEIALLFGIGESRRLEVSLSDGRAGSWKVLPPEKFPGAAGPWEIKERAIPFSREWLEAKLGNHQALCTAVTLFAAIRRQDDPHRGDSAVT